MNPIRQGDGTGLSVPGYSEVRKGDGTVVWSAGSDIPDSVVSRENDNSTFTTSELRGLQINSDDEWPSIGAELSGNTAGATTAYIYRVSDGTLMGQTDISGLSAGGTFTIENVNLQPSTDYNFVVDAGGSDYDAGFYNSNSYPYSSSDGNLRIVGAATGPSSTSGNPIVLKRVGNVGFA